MLWSRFSEHSAGSSVQFETILTAVSYNLRHHHLLVYSRSVDLYCLHNKSSGNLQEKSFD